MNQYAQQQQSGREYQRSSHSTDSWASPNSFETRSLAEQSDWNQVRRRNTLSSHPVTASAAEAGRRQSTPAGRVEYDDAHQRDHVANLGVSWTSPPVARTEPPSSNSNALPPARTVYESGRVPAGQSSSHQGIGSVATTPASRSPTRAVRHTRRASNTAASLTSPPNHPRPPHRHSSFSRPLPPPHPSSGPTVPPTNAIERTNNLRASRRRAPSEADSTNRRHTRRSSRSNHMLATTTSYWAGDQTSMMYPSRPLQRNTSVGFAETSGFQAYHEDLVSYPPEAPGTELSAAVLPASGRSEIGASIEAYARSSPSSSASMGLGAGALHRTSPAISTADRPLDSNSQLHHADQHPHHVAHSHPHDHSATYAYVPSETHGHYPTVDPQSSAAGAGASSSSYDSYAEYSTHHHHHQLDPIVSASHLQHHQQAHPHAATGIYSQQDMTYVADPNAHYYAHARSSPGLSRSSPSQSRFHPYLSSEGMIAGVPSSVYQPAPASTTLHTTTASPDYGVPKVYPHHSHNHLSSHHHVSFLPPPPHNPYIQSPLQPLSPPSTLSEVERYSPVLQAAMSLSASASHGALAGNGGSRTRVPGQRVDVDNKMLDESFRDNDPQSIKRREVLDSILSSQWFRENTDEPKMDAHKDHHILAHDLGMVGRSIYTIYLDEDKESNQWRCMFGTKTTRCRKAGKRFERVERAIEHIRSHMGHRPYACDDTCHKSKVTGQVCGKRFFASGYLEDHKKRPQKRANGSS